MKVVKLKAGLGNQMFQYAFMRLLQEKYKVDETLLDVSYFDSDNFRKYLTEGIDLLSVKYNIATKDDLKIIHVPYNNSKPHTFSHRIISATQALFNSGYYYEKDRGYVNVDDILNHNYFDGYWQSWRYLEPIRSLLTEEFKPKQTLSDKSLEYIKQYRSCNSVFVGVRRGDYLANNKEANHYGAPVIDYYKRAISKIKEMVNNPFFIIFSDDIQWVKDNLTFEDAGVSSTQIDFRDKEKIYSNFEEMYVMAACKHAIISNSTFNFWGAWMINNPDKVVIAPKDWFKDGKPIDIIPPEWIKI